MTYEEDRVVTNTPQTDEVTETATPATPVTRHVVETQPPNVTHTVVSSGNPVDNAFAASQLIQTIVWSVVVLVLLVIAIFLLLHYGIL